jgi:excisionase family DNA binding protein
MAEWLTLPMVAREMGLSRVQVFRLVKKGRLPAARVGRQWMVSRVNLERIVMYRERLRVMLRPPFGSVPMGASEEEVRR